MFFCSTSLPLASTRCVLSTFSSLCPLSSKQCSAASINFPLNFFGQCWDSNPGQLGLEAIMLIIVLCCSLHLLFQPFTRQLAIYYHTYLQVCYLTVSQMLVCYESVCNLPLRHLPIGPLPVCHLPVCHLPVCHSQVWRSASISRFGWSVSRVSLLRLMMAATSVHFYWLRPSSSRMSFSVLRFCFSFGPLPFWSYDEAFVFLLATSISDTD